MLNQLRQSCLPRQILRAHNPERDLTSRRWERLRENARGQRYVSCIAPPRLMGQVAAGDTGLATFS